VPRSASASPPGTGGTATGGPPPTRGTPPIGGAMSTSLERQRRRLALEQRRHEQTMGVMGTRIAKAHKAAARSGRRAGELTDSD
jgi:hypothetical protein